MNISSIEKIENQRKIAILDTSSVSFLQHLDQQDEIDKAVKGALASIDCSHVNYPGLTDEQKCMLALVDEFKRFHPEKEEPYQVESQLYSYFKDDRRY